MSELLSVEAIQVRYGALTAIHGVSLSIREGETVCLLGANGAGKSTILKAIMGVQPPFAGRIRFLGQEIQGLRTEALVRLGIACAPEGKMLFKPLSVEENLLLGAYVLRDEERIRRNLESVYSLFPRLAERRLQPASTLSGGEQQMVAIGRGLMSNPKLLILDEPSLGLAPKLIDEVLETVGRLKQQGMTILLVEQTVQEALQIADRGYVIQSGRVMAEGGRDVLQSDELLRKAYLGL